MQNPNRAHLPVNMKFIIILSISSIFAASVNAQISGTELRPKITRLANKLKEDDEVHFGYPVGFAGKPETNNKYYKKYLKLKSKATNDELVLLTKDDSKPIVICFFNPPLQELWKVKKHFSRPCR
jgi:hypothetical protein